MVRRSQYLVLWSRLGNYAPEDFDALASAADRRIFEGWQHAASLIPLSEYRYQLPRQRKFRDHPSTWYNQLLDEARQKEFVPQVLERIRTEGALKVSNFESDGHPGGGVVELAAGQSCAGIAVCQRRPDDRRPHQIPACCMT